MPSLPKELETVIEKAACAQVCDCPSCLFCHQS
jgi:hypothetical protein